MADERPPVPCLDCGTPCRSEQARARRIGSGCWRKRRARIRSAARAAQVALPGLAGRGDLAGHDGPTLLDQQAEDGTP
jgi:hypothetical protein